jgi:hypothetical protein
VQKRIRITSRLDLLKQLSGAHPYNSSRWARAAEVAAWLAFDSRAVARLGRREHVLCLGDSHAGALPGVRATGAWLHAFAVGGATASGIQNPASRTGARRLFGVRLALAPRWQHLLFALGEVDCGFVIWHRARSHGLAVAEQLRQTLDAYGSFLAGAIGLGFRSVSALSATLPTVAYYGEARGNPGLKMRSVLEVPLRDRTALTLEYNAELAKRCRDIGATFFDTTSEQLDPATGQVRSELVVPGDPHLEPAGYARILSRRLDAPGAPWRKRAGGRA